MKRLVTYTELRGEFPTSIRYHSETPSNDTICMKMSYKTALLFADGQNICSFYPRKTDKPEFWVNAIKDACESNGYTITDERALELAKYMVENVR